MTHLIKWCLSLKNSKGQFEQDIQVSIQNLSLSKHLAPNSRCLNIFGDNCSLFVDSSASVEYLVATNVIFKVMHSKANRINILNNFIPNLPLKL